MNWRILALCLFSTSASATLVDFSGIAPGPASLSDWGQSYGGSPDVILTFNVGSTLFGPVGNLPMSIYGEGTALFSVTNSNYVMDFWSFNLSAKTPTMASVFIIGHDSSGNAFSWAENGISLLPDSATQVILPSQMQNLSSITIDYTGNGVGASDFCYVQKTPESHSCVLLLLGILASLGSRRNRERIFPTLANPERTLPS